MKTLLLSIFLCVFFVNNVFSLTNTYIGANGDWNTAANWSTGLVPIASDDVIIPSGVSVNISANSYANTISLSGTLTVNDGIRLNVYNDFTVNSGGSFLMPGGSALSTLVVYGNYINNGSTDFWKSTVVIVGDLISSATSELQKQGNVVVGGNIIGDFDLTGGTGTGQIYAVNPNATVTITPTSIDNNVAPGTQVVNPPETQTLVDLVNEVIYGGTCPFSITNPTSVAACSGNTKTFSVVASGSAFAYTYLWQVNSGSGWIDLTNVAPYSNVTTGTLTITNVTVGMDKYKYRIKVTSNGCSKNSNYGTLSVSASAPSTPGTISGLTTQCATNANNEIYSVTAVPSATKYNWVFPSGWTITSGLNTNVVTVTTSSAVGGNITVTAENGCGISAARTLGVTISFTAVPTAPVLSAATGITCAAFVANWAAATNATSYILDVSLANGNGSNSFDNNKLATYTNLNIGNVTSYNIILLSPITVYYYRITAVNSCRTTPSIIQTVTTSSSVLGTMPTITGSATACASNAGLVYSITAVANATNYFWTVPSGWIITSGQGTISVIVTSGTSGGEVTVSVGNDCTTSVNINKPVTIDAAPAITVQPLAPATICSGSGTQTISVTATGAGLTYSWRKGGVAVTNGGVISGQGTAILTLTNAITANAGSYDVVVSGTCTPAVTSSAVAVTVNTAPAITVQPTAPAAATCSGTGTQTISVTATGTGLTYSWRKGGVAVVNGGVISGQGTATLTLTNPISVDAGSYDVVVSGSCTPAVTSSAVAVTVNIIPGAPVLPGTLTLGCSATAFDATWVASVNATNYRFDVATDAGFLFKLALYNNIALGNVSTENVTGLTVGSSYYVRLRAVNSCGTSPDSNSMVVSVPTTTYSAGSWNNGAPSASNNIKAIFASDYSLTTVLEACSCQINPGVNVVVGVAGGLNDTAILKIENELNVDPTGTLTFENNASLVQVNDGAVNSGAIIYKRNTNAMKNLDYTHWCSPVKDQVLNVLSPNTQSNKFFSYANGAWVPEAGTNPMNPPGKGFIIRVPRPNIVYPNGENWTGTTYIQKVKFIGKPNNGELQILTQGPSKYNLIGNPYPSAIDADSFINGNVGMVGGALYFWTHNTAITNNAYTSNDYAVYTLTGGTAATTGGATPNGKIASGVAIFVRSIDAGSFVFNNSMRNSADVLDTGSGGPNSQFFKMSNTKKGNISEKSRVWLNLTNSGGAFKQLLIGYVAGASNDFDRLYDGITFGGNTYIDFYSINKTSNLAIQGRALPFEKTDQVPLGYKTTIKGVFTINIDRVEGVLVDQSIFIEDKVTGVIVDLKKGPYSFSTEIGVFKDRFVLRFLSNNITAKTLDTTTFDKVGDSIIVSVKNSQIKINSFSETIDKVMVYDLKGSLIYEKQNVNSNEFSVSDFNSSEQFLIVQILLKNGKWVTQEIVF